MSVEVHRVELDHASRLMEILGRGSLLVALALAVYAAAAGVYAARSRDRRIASSAGRALAASFGCVLVAAIVLWTAIIRHDFRFSVVHDFTSRKLPEPYLFTAFWGSQAGSLLLWTLILTGYGALVVWQNRRRNRELMPWVIAILGAMATFFTFVLVVVSSPFATVAAVQADGNGLDPSLQNPYMMAHPPMLYLGYVGFSVPFAFAMAALLSGHADERWIITTRRWTLSAWTFLGIGILLGAHWAYVEVGWGGFWGWDPVENAALMPWLVGTAFLHSVIVQEKKGMLKIWNVSLIALTFSLSIFGTFLTRSGALSSIHSFVTSSVGWWFIAFLGIVVGFATIVVLSRLDILRSRHRIESVVSREAAFLFNNLLFVALAFAVFWGVMFPIVSRVLRGQTIAVSSPYFDFFAVLFGLPLVFLAAIGPVVAWRRASLGGIVRGFRWPFISASAAGVLLVALGYGSSIPGVVALSLCLFVAITVVLELARGTVARRALEPSLSWPSALVQLVGRNRRRYGGYVVHLGVVVGIVAIVGTTAYSTVHEATLARGQSMHIRDYTLTNLGITRHANQNNIETQAHLRVTQGGHNVGMMTPGRLFFPAEQRNGNEVDIRTRASEDLYVILGGVSANGSAELKVLINPLVSLLWLGGLIIGLGSLIAIWPDPHAARRLARRYAEEPLSGETAAP